MPPIDEEDLAKQASHALWTSDFEARRVAALTPLFQAAVEEYRREVDSSWKRMQTFIVLETLRWIFIGAQLHSFQRFGFAVQGLVGIVIGLGGILMILRGQAYYRAARDHMVRCADELQPGDWSPGSTRRAESPFWKIRHVAVIILTVFLLADLWLFIWALTGSI